MVNQIILMALRPSGTRTAGSPVCPRRYQRQGPVTANVVPGV